MSDGARRGIVGHVPYHLSPGIRVLILAPNQKDSLQMTNLNRHWCWCLCLYSHWHLQPLEDVDIEDVDIKTELL